MKSFAIFKHELLYNFSILLFVMALLAYRFYNTGSAKLKDIIICFAISICNYYTTAKLMPMMVQVMFSRNIWGYDINKNGKKNNIRIPESLGILCGIIFIISEIFQAFLMQNSSEFNASMFSICLILLLGFLDDILNVRWLIKILLSSISTLPILMEYSGPTQILIPKPLRSLLGITIVDLGKFYYAYLCLVIVFCTNGINIYAGINGLETAQTVIIATSVLLFNLIELGGACSSVHVMSMYIILPFLATTLVLAYYNAYPSRVFVGDSFTYFSGMTLVVTSIKSHFTKTLFLFFIPQLINFVLSMPQLLGIVACPKHRLPIYDEKTGKLKYSKNFTLINLVLYIFGPMKEKNLCTLLNTFHILCCAAAFFIRYSSHITEIFYEKAEILQC